MAKVLKNFMFATRSVDYPWDKWLDGRIWEMARGQDFKCAVESFRQLVGTAARKRGGKIRTSVQGKNKIVIQFIAKPAR